MNAIVDFFSFKELYILLKIVVKYIGELLTKWVSSLLSDDWVLKSATPNL